MPTLPPFDSSKMAYVALGDSYSSGEGAPYVTTCTGKKVFLPGTDIKGGLTGTKGCHRSVEAWPVLVAQALGPAYSLSFHACSGAVINDFYGPSREYPQNEPDPQRTWLSPATKLVTFTFGGNDADFAGTISFCASRAANLFDSCLSTLGEADELIDKLAGPPGSWPGHHTLSEFYADIRRAAPNARVLVVGYPRFFSDSPPRSGCGGGGGRRFSEADMLGLNQTADDANRAIKAAAFAAGFEYVDVSDVMNGHDVCAKTNWINRAIPSDVHLSYHPNIAGQKAIAQRIIACIRSTSCASSAQEQFEPFGLSLGNFTWSARNGQITINPPLGVNRYSALWGVFDGQRRCGVTVQMDSTLNNSEATGNFGFAVAPLSMIQSDQPTGASVQYEHEAPPDFPAAGSFVRPAMLPGGAWRVDVPPQSAPDIYRTRHIEVTDSGNSLSIEIDGQHIATYSHQPECGGIAIRAWGASFTFSNIVVNPT